MRAPSGVLLLALLAIAFLTSVPGAGASDLPKCSEMDKDPCKTEWRTYIRNVVTKSGLIAGVVFVIILVVTFLPFFIGRYCCHCFGGSQPSEGLCYVSRDGRPPTYTRISVWLTRGFALVVVILGIVGLIVGLDGSKKVHHAIDAVFTEAHNGVGTVRKMVVSVDATVVTVNTRLDSIASSTSEVIGSIDLDLTASVSTSLDSADSDLDDWHKRAKDLEKVRNGILVGILAACFALLAIGFLAAVAGVRQYVPMIVVCLLFPAGIIVWLVFLVHCPLAFVGRDSCDELRLAAKGENKDFMDLICPAVDELGKLLDSATDLEGDTAQSVCRYLGSNSSGSVNICAPPNNNYSYAPIFDCQAAGFNASDTTFCRDLSRVTSSVNGLTVNQQYATQLCGGSGTCTVASCSTKCMDFQYNVGGNQTVTVPGSSFKSYAGYSLTAANIASDLNTLIKTQLRPLASCDVFLDTFVQPFVPVCDDARKGLQNLVAGSAILGVGVLLGIVAFTLGSKRFQAILNCSKKTAPAGGLHVGHDGGKKQKSAPIVINTAEKEPNTEDTANKSNPLDAMKSPSNKAASDQEGPAATEMESVSSPVHADKKDVQ